MELGELDALAKRLDVAILVIHHGSKGSSGLDWTQAAAGSFAMTAATEGQIHLSRFEELESGAPERLLRSRSRHAADVQVALRFCKETLNFEFLLEGAAAPLYPDIERIRRDMGRDIFGPKEFIEKTGMTRPTAFRLLDRLRLAGAIDRRGHGQYVLVAV